MIVDNIIMIFMDMKCFKEVKFKYRIKFANNFREWKLSVVIFSPLFSIGGFVGFLILNTEFMFT